MSADTIRHYERLGILPKSQRTVSGYRLYTPDAVMRVQISQRALKLGFSLSELSEIFRTREDGVPCQRVLKLTESKLHSLGKQIKELRQTETYMRQLVRDWRKKLKHTPAGEKALLLQSLKDRATPGTKSFRSNLRR